MNFEVIKDSIKQDINSGNYDEEQLMILEESDSHITVYDEVDLFSREYTITNPDVIDANWINEKIIITPSVEELGYRLNQEQIAGWMYEHIDKDMYLTLENILIVNDTEQDIDYLCSYDEKFQERLDVSDLPDENVIGIMWHVFQTVAINIGAIEKATDEMIEEDLLYSYEKDANINEGLFSTLAHEIRHLAQSNPYLPEEILKQQGDAEQDAENYAMKVCDGGFPYVLENEREEEIEL